MMTWFLVVQLPLLGGCQTDWSAAPEKPGKSVSIESILVTSFQVIIPYGQVETISCPVSNAVCQPGTIAEGAEDFLTNTVYTYMKEKTDFHLVPPGRGDRIRYEILKEDLGMSPRRLLVEMGKRLQTEAVLAGTLYRFRQRVGGPLSVETAASVGYGVHLIRVRDGRLLWSRHFDETQKSLSEDLFKFGTFVKRGGAWLTAQELATFGLNTIMADFPASDGPEKKAGGSEF